MNNETNKTIETKSSRLGAKTAALTVALLITASTLINESPANATTKDECLKIGQVTLNGRNTLLLEKPGEIVNLKSIVTDGVDNFPNPDVVGGNFQIIFDNSTITNIEGSKIENVNGIEATLVISRPASVISRIVTKNGDECGVYVWNGDWSWGRISFVKTKAFISYVVNRINDSVKEIIPSPKESVIK
ncbi:MAG: hypothetical protein WCK31_03775 [bacterium]